MPRGKRPNCRILSVAFETSLQDAGRLRFSIPNEIAQLLGIKRSKKRLALFIETLSGGVVYDARKTLTSGTEITGADIRNSTFRIQHNLIDCVHPTGKDSAWARTTPIRPFDKYDTLGNVA